MFKKDKLKQISKQIGDRLGKISRKRIRGVPVLVPVILIVVASLLIVGVNIANSTVSNNAEACTKLLEDASKYEELRKTEAFKDIKKRNAEKLNTLKSSEGKCTSKSILATSEGASPAQKSQLYYEKAVTEYISGDTQASKQDAQKALGYITQLSENDQNNAVNKEKKQKLEAIKEGTY